LIISAGGCLTMLPACDDKNVTKYISAILDVDVK
jgi:hypothetical protein